MRPRNVLVTGGASGFGLAIARRMAEEGANVAVGDSSADRLASVATSNRFFTVDLDVTKRPSILRAVRACERTLGGIDALILSAGVVHIRPLADVTEAEWDHTIDVNLKGVFLTVQAAAPALRTSGRGRIVAIASDAARYGYAHEQAYCASKFGLLGLCQSLAAELAPDKVTVNCICPSACPTTTMGKALTQWKANSTGLSEAAVLREIALESPLGRHAREGDIAAAAAYFLSDDASFVTGAVLDVDGGSHFATPAGLPMGQSS